MLSSELGSIRSLRRFRSVGTEYAAVVLCVSVAQQYPYICSCIVRQLAQEVSALQVSHN